MDSRREGPWLWRAPDDTGTLTPGLLVENESWYDSVDWFHQIGVDPNVAAPPDEVPDVAAVLLAR